MSTTRQASRFTLLPLLACASPTAYAAFIVPVYWGGDLGYTYRQANYEPSQQTVQHQVTGTINTRSYIWQPWFATADVSLAGTHDESKSNQMKTHNDLLTGNLNLNVLPRSHVPFSLRYSASDSTIGSEGVASTVPGSILYTDQHLRRRLLTVTQGYYRTRDRITARYDNDRSESERDGTYTNETFGLDYSLRLPHQNLEAKAQQQEQTRSRSNDTTHNNIASLNHRYYPHERMTVNSLLSHVKYRDYYTPSGTTTLQSTITTTNQVGSNLSWRSLDRKLSINGGFRAFQRDMDYTGAHSEQEGASITARGMYLISKNLRASAGVQENIQKSNGQQSSNGSQQLGLGYTSDMYRLGEFDYNWYTSGDLANQRNETESIRTTTLTLGHGAVRRWPLAGYGSLRLSLNQSASSRSASNEADHSGQLSHGLSLGWNQSGNGGDSMAQLSFSDTRGTGSSSYESQLVNVQASRTQTIDRRSSLRGNVTAQFTRQHTAGQTDHGFNRSLTGTVGYRYDRPLGLQRVSFTSELKIIDNAPATGAGRQEKLWENKLTHSIGKLYSTLTLRLQEEQSARNSLLILQVKRTF